MKDSDTEPVIETDCSCPSCAGKKSPAGKSSSAGKRKATGAPSLDGGTASKKPAQGQPKTRTRLIHGQKVEILGLMNMKVSHDEIARRFNCRESTVSKIATAKKSI